MDESLMNLCGHVAGTHTVIVLQRKVMSEDCDNFSFISNELIAAVEVIQTLSCGKYCHYQPRS